MGCYMRLGWAFHSRSVAALVLASAGIAPAQSFSPIFNGRTLTGWDGDPAYWRVEDGAIVGETKAGAIPKQNTFLIWRGGSPADFELRLEYRLTGGNSGIQYRSLELPDIRWAMKGYQADIDAEQRFTGQIYEERGRGFLALRGQTAQVEARSKPVVLGTLASDADLKGVIHAAGWNSYDIVARGNALIQVLNGRVMCVLVDEDTLNRKMEGLIGIQLHAGEPMKIEVKNIELKKL